MSRHTRVRAICRGRVQGVGFRATAHAIAGGFPVAGYVRNLPDGTVELVIDGPEVEVERCLQSIRIRFSGNIDHTDFAAIPADRPLSGFEIRW